MTATLVRSFPRQTASVTAARHWACDALASHKAETLDNLALMMSEVVANAIRHGKGTVAVSVFNSRDQIRFEVVDDGSDGEPHIREPELDGDERGLGGWGLHLVDEISTAWGTERTPAGCRLVWVELKATP